MPSNLMPLHDGAVMTSTFKTENNNILSPKYQDRGILPTCETFNRDVFDLYLADERCVGIRVYSGMDESLDVKFVIVGVDANDEDIYLQPNPSQPLELFVIENGFRCPDSCPPASVLNA